MSGSEILVVLAQARAARTATLGAVAAMLLSACGAASTGPGSPSSVSVEAGATPGTAVVSFGAPPSGDAVTRYTVTVSPGGFTASGASSPITVTGLSPQTAYSYSVVAAGDAGTSAAVTTGPLRFYAVVETFHEPMTQPNDTVFTGTFTYDTTNRVVTNLKGSLTQSMTKVNGVYAGPMTTVSLTHARDVTPVTLGGVAGFLVTTFALDTSDTFDPSGFAPGGTQYYGLAAGAPSAKNGGVGNAYAMVFVNAADPLATPAQAQLDKLAYGDCTAGGLMMTTCMTGTAMAGYGRMGTMMGVPVSQVTTER